MDRITEQTAAALRASIEVAECVPPADLAGPALAMFRHIVAANHTRTWGGIHALILADYCRVAVMRAEQWAALQDEGPVVSGKANRRLGVVRMLTSECTAHARLLGIGSGSADRFSNKRRDDEHARAAGTALQKSAATEGGDLLA